MISKENVLTILSDLTRDSDKHTGGGVQHHTKTEIQSQTGSLIAQIRADRGIVQNELRRMLQVGGINKDTAVQAALQELIDTAPTFSMFKTFPWRLDDGLVASGEFEIYLRTLKQQLKRVLPYSASTRLARFYESAEQFIKLNPDVFGELDEHGQLILDVINGSEQLQLHDLIWLSLHLLSFGPRNTLLIESLRMIEKIKIDAQSLDELIAKFKSGNNLTS